MRRGAPERRWASWQRREAPLTRVLGEPLEYIMWEGGSRSARQPYLRILE